MLMTRDAQLAPGRLHIVPAAREDVDAVTATADPHHRFLRGAWFAAIPETSLFTMVRSDGRPLAGFGLTGRRIGPFVIREIAGSYWPFRGLALAADAQIAEVAAMLSDRETRRVLGKVWRLGPTFADDPALRLLREAAKLSDWKIVSRSLGTCFEIDVAALTTEGAWPRASTLKKNRWREKKLGEIGDIAIHRFTGADWRAEDREAIARIERNSWLAAEAKAGLQFADAPQRGIWERVADDPVLAAMLHGSLLRVGGEPAAFTFALRTGSTLYQMANNYDARFAEHSPGRTLLIREFEHAAQNGVTRISWGSGDAGYKSEMGAQPGPEIVDLLFVKSKATALALARLWKTA